MIHCQLQYPQNEHNFISIFYTICSDFFVDYFFIFFSFNIYFYYTYLFFQSLSFCSSSNLVISQFTVQTFDNSFFCSITSSLPRSFCCNYIYIFNWFYLSSVERGRNGAERRTLVQVLFSHLSPIIKISQNKIMDFVTHEKKQKISYTLSPSFDGDIFTLYKHIYKKK